jgi:hypothetical protein
MKYNIGKGKAKDIYGMVVIIYIDARWERQRERDIIRQSTDAACSVWLDQELGKIILIK